MVSDAHLFLIVEIAYLKSSGVSENVVKNECDKYTTSQRFLIKGHKWALHVLSVLKRGFGYKSFFISA